MYDDRSGAMTELPDEIFAALKKSEGTFKQRLAESMRKPEFIKQAGEAAGIPAERQGPVFTIDEEVELKGRRFRVRGFEGGLLHLQGIPNVPDQMGRRTNEDEHE